MNAREGIKTRAKQSESTRYSLKTMNAREGIKTDMEWELNVRRES